MWIGREAFGDIYRYMIRYMKRYKGTAYKLLVTVEFPGEKGDPALSAEERDSVRERVRILLQQSLRSSDIMMQIGDDHFFLLLPGISPFSLNGVLERINTGWEKEKEAEHIRLNMEAESI